MADPDASLTPEQRLLKIIEGGGDPHQEQASSGFEGGEAPFSEPRKKREPINWKELFSPTAIRGRLEYLKDSIQNQAKEQSGTLTVKTINRFLVGGCILLALVIVGNAAFEMRVVSRDFLSRFDLSQKKMADLLMGGTHDVSQLFTGGEPPRNVFAPYVEKAGGTESVSSDVALKLLEMVKTLKLTGISYFEGDASRTFCMIEDIQKNITTFLKQGESFTGLTVKEIKPDSVMLSLGTEEIEIR